ncbi:MAG TPA: glycerate kinase [Dehalococcoidia bacterium]
MKVVVAPQEFKGSLTAAAAAAAMAAGVRRAAPGADVAAVPVADGGPGTMGAVVAALGGRVRRAPARDPLLRPVTAEWGWVPRRRLAVIELAAASGLWRLAPGERDALRASSYGTGELIRAALDAGARRILLGLGGSATNDAGAGLVQALGVRLLDRSGAPLPPGGGALLDLHEIDASGLDPRLREAAVEVAVDVRNPLLGPEGASLVYGPQKGATPEQAARLDRALAVYAAALERLTGRRLADVPGAGAAGGAAVSLMTFAGATLAPGFELVARTVGLAERLAGADLVLTGEGRLDRQTGYGKAVAGVARLARAAGAPAVAVVGASELTATEARALGLAAVLSLTSGTVPPEEAQRRAAGLVTEAAAAAVRLVLAGRLVDPAGEGA